MTDRIVRELVLSTGGDDDMGTLLGMMHSAPPSALQLKAHILKSLLMCLRESHRTRTVFRKVGGFVYVMSVLVSMEGCLSGSPSPPWDEIPVSQVLHLLHMVFNTVTVAMRFEPANAKFFHLEICLTSLCDTLRLLGCFSSQQYLDECDETTAAREENTFHNLFTSNILEPSIPGHIPVELSYACIVLRLLYDVALDAYDKPNLTAIVSFKSPTHRRHQSEANKLQELWLYITTYILWTIDDDMQCRLWEELDYHLNVCYATIIIIFIIIIFIIIIVLAGGVPKIIFHVSHKLLDSPGIGKRAAVNSLNLTPPAPDPIIVHPGVVVAMLHLLPSIYHSQETQVSLTLQMYASEVLKSLVRSEHNQQVMCEAGLPGQLLSVGKMALEDETHPLHPPLQYMLERLAAQTLEPRDLRDFLRLGDPLCCIPMDSMETRPPHRKPGGPVPLTRVKTLVSMTTPRDFRATHGSTTLPPFVEFDMSAEGFGCLYLPSVAPQSPTGPSVVTVGNIGTVDTNVVGGIGSDPHCVRLLTLVRNLHGERDDHLVCLAVVLSARDKAIIVTTQETAMPHKQHIRTRVYQLRTVMLLDETVTVQKHGKEITKPKVIIVYNNSKAFIDISDQVKAYNTSLRRGIKWYLTKNKMSITRFKEILCEELLGMNNAENDEQIPNVNIPENHVLQETDRRKRCEECYKKITNVSDTGEWEPEPIGDSVARVWCPDLLQEGQWHHLVLVLNRAVLKNSSFSLYVDGKHVHTQKPDRSRLVPVAWQQWSEMEALIPSPAACEVRSVIKFFNAQSIALIEIHRQLCQVYGSNIMSKQMVRRWCRQFSEGRQSVHDEERSGRPSLINDDRLELVRQCIMEDRRFTITELSSHFPQISRSLLHEIVTKHLLFKKVCARWVPKNLTPEHKMQRLEAALTFLQRYHDDGAATSSSTGSSRAMRLGFCTSLRKPSRSQCISGIVDLRKDILLIDFLPRGETVNADRYCETLRKLRRAIQNKRRGMLTAGVVLLHDNARPHMARLTAAVLTEFGWELFHPPPYSPDLAPSDFHVFLHLKKFLSSGTEPLPSLVSEEKVIFGLNAKAVSQLTLAKIRKVYSRADNKAIAKQLGMSSHENATPIRILHNSAGHLGGPARSLGGVVIGYLGVRVFSPRPVAKMIENVGGCSVLLGLIAMAQDVESLYAAVKALVCVVRTNRTVQLEMDRRRGYQTLAMLLRRKRPLLNSHILHLTFSLVGTVDSGRESSSIPNTTAFQDLLCDIEFIAATFPNSSEKNLALLETAPSSSIMQSEQTEGEEKGERESDSGSNIVLRNRCLQLLHSLLFTARNHANQGFCDEVTQVLGLDWVLLFLQGHLHPTTVVWGLRILVVLCSCPPLLQKFREGSSNGGWLRDTELVLQNKMAVVLVFCPRAVFYCKSSFLQSFLFPVIHFVSACYQLGTSTPKTPGGVREIKSEALYLPGFQRLNWLLPQHIDVPEVYFLLMALMMGQPVKLLPADSSKLDLDSVWNFMFGVPASQSVTSVAGRVSLCPEAVMALLAMVRAMLNQEGKSPDSLPEWLRDYPVTIIQFLFFLYHNMADFMPVFMGGDVLGALAGTLFPRQPGSEAGSGASTPGDEIKDAGLSSHPARKFVMDFLRVIVVDSLSLPVSGKGPPAIDLVLDASPDTASMAQQTRFQTEVLGTLMEHLLAADVLIGEQAALPVVPGGSPQYIAPNVCYLASRIVDKLWQGTFAKDPHEVFDFVVKLISQAKRRPPGQFPLEGLYHCLNRTTLFLLSRSTDNIADQMAVLEALHKLTTHRLLLFGAGNHELDFVGCLTYCLLQLTADMRIMLDSNIRTTWHVNPQMDESDDKLTSHQGHNLMAVAARRVWEELYVSKKPAIEEVFKVTLPSGPNNKAPDLTVVREQVYEAANKLWLNYVDMERKASYRVPWELQSQIQSVLLAFPYQSPKEIQALLMLLDYQRVSEFLLEPELDSGDNKALKYKVASSWDSKEFYQKYRPQSLLERERDYVLEAQLQPEDPTEKMDVSYMTGENGDDIGLQGVQCATVLERHGVHRSISEPDDAGDDADTDATGSEEPDNATDNQTLIRLLEEQEKISHMFRCARIQGLDTTEGLLLFGKEHFYVIDGFTLLKSREIRDIESLPSGMHDPILPSPGSPRRSRAMRQCSKFSYEDIRSDATVFMSETSVTQRWVRGEISNFQYLMHLNTLAGRSYNDLMQYPVFPWILADYESEELELSDPATFRDFSRPMGAQSPERLEQFKKRYKEWDDPHGETPPYHYGTHYSSAMIVCSYLVRMEPFTQHFLRLQGGHFDLADRMFNSVREAWLSASKHNMADVKELIPEFFYLPEFLCNSNNFDLVRIGRFRWTRTRENSQRSYITGKFISIPDAHSASRVLDLRY
ncbi:hypothetical protein ANN_14800 [Periplaneta americana]|uniref:WD repeat and FYVE domain-containing protein 3 n=1 Tax=Periplaneta americana TaxID=6978 RepID=A0ABQ8SYT7_PERAM|nr:hypothetical protein ANN_14800 [Periplaneta americana]